MASSSDVVEKVMRFKLQLADTAQSATVVKILKKLKDLDITLDILAETGIGKTVNLLRRHEEAGEFAKSLVRGWKRLVPKESTSKTEDGAELGRLSVKGKVGHDCPNNGSLALEDLNNNCLTSQDKSQDSSDEASFKKRYKKTDAEKQCEDQKINEDWNEHEGESQKAIPDPFQNDVLHKKIKICEDNNSVISKKKKNDQSKWNSGDKDASLKSKSDSREKRNRNSDSGRCESEKESHKKSMKSNETSKEVKEYSPFESGDESSDVLKLDTIEEGGSPGRQRSPENQEKNRKKKGKEKHTTLKYDDLEHSKHKVKKAKTKHEKSDSGTEEPSASFESCLNYETAVFKRKDRAGVKKPPKKIKLETTTSPFLKTLKSPVMSFSVASPKRKFKESVMELMSIPLPAVLQFDNTPSLDFFERKVEKEPDLPDGSEDSAVFTGQRLNKKMQVYSGAKTSFLPTMMSLHQQCIRTLQNNIDLLYETGGVPFEILEPVLERCTSEQLLRIEECNPMYIGATDHLWGKHCQRDFKDYKLQEYESWKEMYVRLSEERERKLQRLTKTIVSANSKKPKGRQVKMAFIHTVAKPPRDVRIQQEIYGTAVQQPHQPKCSPKLSVKVQDNRPRPSTETSSSSSSSNNSSSTSSGAANTQDPRKKTRVAPMMAKSLKAFRKQFGRR